MADICENIQKCPKLIRDLILHYVLKDRKDAILYQADREQLKIMTETAKLRDFKKEKIYCRLCKTKMRRDYIESHSKTQRHIDNVRKIYVMYFKHTYPHHKFSF
jgi:hypothetical protein